jgi:hypothetical protein
LSIDHPFEEPVEDAMTGKELIPRSESASAADPSPAPARPGPARSRRGRLLAVLPVGLLGVLLLGGCGSSKPAFCSHVSELEKSVQSLGSLNAQSGVSGLEADLKKIDSSAKAVVSSAKSEFPTQTAAIEKSVTALDNTVKELSSATTTGARNAAIAKLPGEVSAADTAFSEFSSAAKSKCS